MQAGGEVRSTEPLLSTHPLTEPRKVTDFVSCCNGRKCRKMLDVGCVAMEEMPMAIECVLFCNVRKCRKMLDVGCVAPDEMP